MAVYDLHPYTEDWSYCKGLWEATKELTEHLGSKSQSRSDRVLYLYNREVLNDQDCTMLLTWLNVFQTEEFAQ